MLQEWEIEGFWQLNQPSNRDCPPPAQGTPLCACVAYDSCSTTSPKEILAGKRKARSG